MVRLSRWGMVGLVSCACAALLGCAAGPDKAAPDDRFAAGLAGAGGGKADSSSIAVIGQLSFGQQAAPVAYHDPPRYLAYGFRSGGGDQVDLRVQGLDDGDAVAWLLDAAGNVLAQNDDASSSTLDSRIKLTVPAATAVGELYAVFRDYWLEDRVFQVSLAGRVDYVTCAVDADCSKIEAGCCPVGDWVAVRADRVDDYEGSLDCQPQVCPERPIVDHGESAICDNNSHTCEIVLPDDMQCGGLKQNAHQCPAGWTCEGPDLPADGTGTCVAGG